MMKFFENSFNRPNEWFRYLLTCLLSFVVFAQILGGIPLMILIGVKAANQGGVMTDPLNFEAYGVSSTLGLGIMLFSFVMGLFGLWLFFKVFHKKPFTDLFNGQGTFRWKRFFYAVGIWGGLMLVYLVGQLLITPEAFHWQFDWRQFYPLLIVSVILIPLQTSYEELLFRGYLAQGVGVWTRNRWLVVIIPAAIFALMHIMNPEVEAYGFWLTMPQYLFFGLLFGICTVLDDGLEVCLGAHAINNVFLSLFVTSEESVFKTHSVLKQVEIDPVMELISLLVLGTLFFFIMYKLLGWKWKVMNDKIAPTTLSNQPFMEINQDH
ncbi:type II CAAX endopeptidase family protein [Persicobacter diffluens]